MSNKKHFVAALFVACALVGCDDKPQPQKVTALPKPPPAVPMSRNEPIDPTIRGQARVVIGDALRTNDPIIRANAVEALQTTTGAANRTEIINALSDKNELVRFAASMASGQLKLREAEPILLGMIDEPSPHVAIGVRFALHKLGNTAYSHELERFANDPSPSVRGDLCLALGLLGEPTGLRVLRAMINDQNPTVRLQVAEAMWRLGSEEGLNILSAGTISQFADDQVFCVLALAAPRDARVTGNLEGKLVGDYVEVNLAAARALGMIGSDKGYTVAMQSLHNADPRQRALAALALGAIARSDAQHPLSGLLSDGDQNVKLAAATAVLQLRGPLATAMP
jgi:HEAT repeat protein